MPTAFDRGIPPADKNPLVDLPDWRSVNTPTTPGDPFTGPVTAVLDDLTGGFKAWINSLFGLFRPVQKVTGSVVGDEHPELLIAPDFRAAGTISIGNNWTWTNEAGYDSLGCARLTAAGYLSELLSNEIPVTGGQTVLDLSVRVQWDDVTFTGSNPICLGVTRYMNRTEVGSEDLAFVAAPASSSGWVQLYDDLYQVPDDCDEIRLRFKGDVNLLTGTVDFDNASVKAVGMGLIDKIVQGLENQDTPGWNHIDLLLSMFNQFRTTTDHASRITYLEMLNSPGNKINDEFLRTGADLGANWNLTSSGAGAGSWQTDGDYAFWQDSGFGDKEIRGRYIGTPAVTTTDTQQIIAVIGSRGESSPLLAVHSYFDLYGRMDTGGTNWVRARFRSDGQVKLTTSISGTLTDIATTTGDPLSAGATVILTCGTASGTRFFRVDINGVAILGGDASPVSDLTSNFGASYRGYGMGVRSEGSILLLGQTTPPKINAWAAKDN